MSANLPPSQVATATITAVPVGTIVAFGCDPASLPPGWLLCDGSQFNQTKYPDLYAARGNSNTVPDLRGYFLRGLDTTGNVDPDGSGRTIMSQQPDEFGTHQHKIWPMQLSQHYYHFSDDAPGWPYVGDVDASNHINTGPPTDAGSGAAIGGKETRPKNVAVHYLIYAGLMREST